MTERKKGKCRALLLYFLSRFKQDKKYSTQLRTTVVHNLCTTPKEAGPCKVKVKMMENICIPLIPYPCSEAASSPLPS